jgi:glycosyltransferase 2 family protein
MAEKATQPKGPLATLTAAVLLPREAKYTRRRVDLLRLALAALGLCATGLLVSGSRVSAPERRVFVFINRLPGTAEPVLWIVMQAGAFGAVFVAAGLALAARRRRLAVALVAGGTGTWLAAKVVKLVVERDRPAGLLHDVVIRGPAATGLGFPSGHAAVATLIMTVAGPYLTRPARWTGWVVVGLVAFNRVFIGAHFPVDVAGGLCLGWSLGSLVNLVFGTPDRSPAPPGAPHHEVAP